MLIQIISSLKQALLKDLAAKIWCMSDSGEECDKWAEPNKEVLKTLTDLCYQNQRRLKVIPAALILCDSEMFS